MLNLILKYGVIAGLAVGIPMSIITLSLDADAVGHWGMAIGYTTMLIALSAVFVAIKRRRDDDQGGVIRFWPAFGMGLGISAVASVIYVVAWEAATAIAGIDFGKTYADMLIRQQAAKGVAGPALEAFKAQMAQFRASYADPLYRLPMTFMEIFPVGVLVSLVSAGLLRNPRFMPARRS